ncbi:hypothetical protein [Planctobacterium marinum]|uniref:hypothetical protein n=1 Tax=Planctobacterium marinum TaxID=1631968 RepID=UPI001E4F5DB1|nr:hypothetical protein [Planctobacterium marinum]MCC2606367.1 hypothetical protein [Planctobacterium marinum]
MQPSTSGTELLQRIITFLEQVGVQVKLTGIDGETFLPGVTIHNGQLWVDSEKLEYPGDLLHEAGHIAVQPAATRHLLNENVNDSGQSDGEEIAAIAWSWAALEAIGLPPEVVFHEAGYRGSSKNLIECFQSGGFYGQPLLSYFGMCKPLNEPGSFPNMLCWLRP